MEKDNPLANEGWYKEKVRHNLDLMKGIPSRQCKCGHHKEWWCIYVPVGTETAH